METDRLYIELSSSAYAKDLYEDYQSDFVNEFNVFEKLDYNSYKKLLDQDIPDEIQYVVVLKNSEIAIGWLCINKDSLRYHSQSVQISYWIKEMYAQQGYMKEALNALIEYIFEETQIQIISARIFSSNHASQKLVKSLGFEHEANIRCVYINKNNEPMDDTIYSLFKL